MNPLTLLQPLHPTQKLTMGCHVIDRCLGGGIPCKSITELVGESGCGKTQLCLQLTMTAQLPPSHGGLSASSIFIHTEFHFPITRLQQLSQSFRHSHPNLLSPDPSEHVYVHSVEDAHQLLHLMTHIESFACTTRLPVRLIVIDSIAALFRSQFENTPSDMKRRSDLFFKISIKLKMLAERFGMAVVVTNQVTDVVGNNVPHRVGNLRSFVTSGRHVCPSLGLAWSHCMNSRFFLSRFEESFEVEGPVTQTKRRLEVVLSPYLPYSLCEFIITPNGVLGVE